MIAKLPIPRHEVFPQSHRIWLEEREDGCSVLEKRLISWFEDLSSSEELFKKHVYENPEMDEGDLRQHRVRIYSLMAQGEAIAFEFQCLGLSEDTKNHIAVTTQKLRGLWDTLHAWHGSIEEQEDVPDSFKRGLADIEAGKVVDLERALTEKP